MVEERMGRAAELTIDERDQLLFERIGRKATKLGMKWEKGCWPGFNHETGAHYADDHADLIHELGHFLVSPKKYRHEEYFGLGHPALVSKGEAKMPYWRCTQLECEASILGIVLYEDFKAPIALASKMFHEHNWDDATPPYPITIIKRLEKKGLWNEKRQRYWERILKRR